MIDEKKLLEKLGIWYGSLFPKTSIQDSIKCDVIDNVMTMIEDVEKVDEWIPVSERLPKPDTYVLVTYKNFDDFAIGIDRYDQNIHDWFCFEEGVMAWQPLPKVFEGE